MLEKKVLRIFSGPKRRK